MGLVGAEDIIKSIWSISALCETYLSVLESCNLDNELRDFVDLFWDLLQIKKSYNYEEIDHV